MNEYNLTFDGYKISLRQNNITIKSWDAISGRPGQQSPSLQNVINNGPIPSGNWAFSISNIQTITMYDDVVGTAGGLLYSTGIIDKFGRWPGGTISWGLSRVFLEPQDGTNTYGRTNFSIHGGDQYGSAGCIDLGHLEVDFFKTLSDLGIGQINLNVDYDNNLYTEEHPLSGEILGYGPFSRGATPTDHLGNPINLARCFAAGTKILMSDGNEKPIEEVSVGDFVMSFETFGELTPKKVLRTFQNTTDSWLLLSFNHDDEIKEILTTPTHSFLGVDGLFHEINDLIGHLELPLNS